MNGFKAKAALSGGGRDPRPGADEPRSDGRTSEAVGRANRDAVCLRRVLKKERTSRVSGFRKLLLGGAIAVFFLAAGCTSPKGPGMEAETGAPDAKPAEATNPAAEKQEAEPPAVKAPYTYPLTGMPSEIEAKERPVMVMVENSPQARPQTGLDEADIVYEILAEGEITRFAAVYQSRSPKTVGPVRSIRPYYVEIGDGLDALIVHAGWSQEAINMIAGRKLAHFDQVYGDGEYFWRDPSRKMPHNLYTGIERIRKGAKDKKYRTDWNGPILRFAQPQAGAVTSDANSSGQAHGKEEVAAQTGAGSNAGSVTLFYPYGYTVSYRFDAATGTFLRSMNGEAHKDKLSGRTLSAANVLICEAKHRVVDKEGRRDVDVFGPGKGYLLQRGTKRDITWERKEGIIRAYADGKELEWVPGQTWVQLVPQGTKVAFE